MWQSSDGLIGAFMFLLPGLVAASIFQALISNRKPTAFDLIVRAFIFTMAVGFVVESVVWIANIAEWGISVEDSIFVPAIIAVLLGLGFAYVWNNDLLHKLLRWLKMTRQSSYQSAQYSAFAFHQNCYVVLHLKRGRRLYGWPQEWPSRPDDQHFLIEECEWLAGKERHPIEGVSHILIPAPEVEMIEFLPRIPSADR